MKIVQSLWSKPAVHQGGYPSYNGHWPEPCYFWYSWVISTGWAQRHYGNVELVTDDQGAQWLVDTLKLPFTSVRTDLQSLNVSDGLWACGKIIAYDLQKEPFFHIDGDVYLDGRLPERYEKADLVCQFLERAADYDHFRSVYEEYHLAMERCLPRLPACWKFKEDRCAGNCGIFGGANLAAIKQYTRAVIALINDPENQAGWAELKRLHTHLNCIFEQQILWCSAREQGIPLTPLFEPAEFLDPSVFECKARETHFNHAAVDGKNVNFGRQLAAIVEREFPMQFAIISDLIRRNFPRVSIFTGK